MADIAKSVMQPWVLRRPYMQQSVLIATVRGPDGIRKDHVAKLLLRWLRRCIMVSAFEGCTIRNPMFRGGGSFTGPSLPDPSLRAYPDGIGADFNNARMWAEDMTQLVKTYLSCVDELPHHFQLHFMHAAEIIGYHHPHVDTMLWWQGTYESLVNDMHLQPESKLEMDMRLSDSEEAWRSREEVVAKGPEQPPCMCFVNGGIAHYPGCRFQ